MEKQLARGELKVMLQGSKLKGWFVLIHSVHHSVPEKTLAVD